MTNVFISWSGELSKDIAEELRSWIPSVLQFAKPYFTPNDIEKGSKWSTEISKSLSETHVGIICLTKENSERPWILFEAGALSKDLEQSKVCSVLFGMENADLKGPLVTFQTTEFRKSDFRKLMSTINDAGGDRALTKETFDNVFNMWWPKLEEKIKGHLTQERTAGAHETRSERDILEEILDLSRIGARKAPLSRSQYQVSHKFVLDFLDTLSDGIFAYEKSTTNELQGVLEEQLELCRHLVRWVNKNDGELLAERLETLRARFDDIIPF